MIVDEQPTSQKPSAFGTRLKVAREALGLDRKEAAAQIRLQENMIAILENENYPQDLPITFLRGYIRLYAKFLQIPENEVKQALELIQPKPVINETASLPAAPLTSSNYFMQTLTYLVMVTIISLVGIWWYTHSNSEPVVAENATPSISDKMTPIETLPTLHSNDSPTSALPPNLTNPATDAVTTPAPENATNKSLEPTTHIANNTDAVPSKVANGNDENENDNDDSDDESND
jgi:cytoskeleton protein RodZ